MKATLREWRRHKGDETLEERRKHWWGGGKIGGIVKTSVGQRRDGVTGGDTGAQKNIVEAEQSLVR